MWCWQCVPGAYWIHVSRGLRAHHYYTGKVDFYSGHFHLPVHKSATYHSEKSSNRQMRQTSKTLL